MSIIPISAPHAHGGATVARVMYTVMLALAPAALYGVWLFGWPALNLIVITLVSALLTESLGLKLLGHPQKPFLSDGSALLTGLLLAMSLPPYAPWWIAALGGVLAVLVGKSVFGGIGQNLFNPAMVARVALLISFPLEMTTWVKPVPLTSPDAPGFLESLKITFSGSTNLDGVTGASVLGHVKTEAGVGHGVHEALGGYGFDLLQATAGTFHGSLGETSAALILAGGLYLILKGIISWRIPLSMLATVALLAMMFQIRDPALYPGVAYHLLTGGLMLGAFFIATDPVTSPSSPRGQLIFGAGCGALIFIIRTWGGYPEGVAFAVLLMNAATPLIDHYTRPRIYGRNRKGEPLPSER